MVREFPAGWDPACHALIADRILETGRFCADWRPFETIPMRYPQAFHAMTALLALLAGLPVHRVLQGLHFLLMFPAGWLVWDFARRGFGRRAALPAFLLFAGLTNTGNYLYFYRMGMLPTELGFLFFLGTFACALRWRPGRFWPLAAGWLLLAATALMHPLSLAMSGAVWLGVWVTSPHRRLGGFAWRLLAGGLAAAALRWLPAWRFHLAGGNESLRFAEEGAVPLRAFLVGADPAALILAWFGLCGWRHRLRAARRRLWAADAAVLFGLFFLMEYGFRYWIARPFFGEDFTLGIPSRLIGVAGGVLAVFGGASVGLVRSRAWRAVLMTFLIAAAVLRYARLTFENDEVSGDVSLELRVLAAAVREKTPENAFCILPAGMPDYQWFCYLAQRRSPALPLPASEDRGPVEAEWALFGDFDANRMEIAAWLREHPEPCFALVPTEKGWYLAAPDETGRLRLLPGPLLSRH